MRYRFPGQFQFGLRCEHPSVLRIHRADDLVDPHRLGLKRLAPSARQLARRLRRLHNDGR